MIRMIRRNKKEDDSKAENPFAMSIGDLMAALLLIFVLLLAATLLRLQDEFSQKVNIAEAYQDVQKKLYNELQVAFKDSLAKWNGDLDSTTLSIWFKEPDVLFNVGQANLKPGFKLILNNFFTKYLDILYQQKYRDNIEEIRIEGHTSSDWTTNVSPNIAYYNNMKLSQDRTRSVLEYCLEMIDADSVKKKWSKERITANGLSSSKLKFINGQEDKELSRRVEFRIKTDAEKQISKLLNLDKANGALNTK